MTSQSLTLVEVQIAMDNAASTYTNGSLYVDQEEESKQWMSEKKDVFIKTKTGKREFLIFGWFIDDLIISM